MTLPKKPSKSKSSEKSPTKVRRLAAVEFRVNTSRRISDNDFSTRLTKYIETMNTITNESGRSHRFSMFLQEVLAVEFEFISRYTRGIENALKLSEDGQLLRGRADSLFGNIVVEFKRAIPASLVDAEEQLRKYIAILWSSEKAGQHTPYIAIATDGVRFCVYSPTVFQTQVSYKPENITLTKIDEVDWSRMDCEGIWLWLDRYFLREETMLPQTDTIVRDFGIDSHVFKTVTNLLGARWQELKHISSFDVVYDSWEKYLRIVYGGKVGADALFIRHTYLATFAKLLSWLHISDNTETLSDDEINDVIGGLFFKNQGIDNFIEEDFFSWIVRDKVKNDGIRIVRWIVSILRRYDLQQLSEDVLKSLYQELVDPQTRRYLGEFYTPDWLANKIVNESLDKVPRASILDPSCGSGTFLYLAIQRKRMILGDSQHTLNHILANICGIDIHPLAVIIAKTNYILALGDLLDGRTMSISIPVYLADSIRLPEQGQMSVFMQVPSFRVKLDGRDVFLAEEFLKDYALYDQTIELAREYANSHKGKSVDFKSFKQSLKVANYPRFTDEHFTRAAFEIAQALKYFIDKDRDSIWSYVLKNIYRPLFLKNQFDFVLGNPPWLAYRAMERGYQQSLKDLIQKQYKLYAGRSETMSSLEIATLFLIRTADLYLRKGGEITFVLPRSIFSSEQHDYLRRKNFQLAEDTECTLDWQEVWDLKDVKPIFKVPCCVLNARKVNKNLSLRDNTSICAKVYSGRLSSRNLTLEKACSLLKFTAAKLDTQTIGQRSFWSTDSNQLAGGRSAYFQSFREGATLVPRSCWFVEPSHQKLGMNSRSPMIRSEAQAMSTAKEPYNDVCLKGTVESEFLYGTLTGTEVIPFGHNRIRMFVLPAIQSNNVMTMLTAKDARMNGYLALSKWLQQVESVWEEKRGDKVESMSVYDRINHNNGITRQNTKAKFRVVYNGSGKNLSAAVISYDGGLSGIFNGREFRLSGFIADCKLFYFETNDSSEAHYLAAILNSSVTNQLIKPMQSHGEHNPRDIHKKVFELPIPKFDSKDGLHKRLANLASNAAKKIESWLKKSDVAETQSIAKTRKEARMIVSKELSEIDELVTKMFKSI